MLKKLFSLTLLFTFAIILANLTENQGLPESLNLVANNGIFKKVLDNGLTVLVKPTNNQTDVSIQMWYKVGSKDEQTSEKGLAHLLEHTVFKGTRDLLSESDIDATTHKLSGSCNAMTCYDWTKYYFNLPERHWKEALPILADCMTNCTLKQDLLNSEFKAVIQELKMYRDNYEKCLTEEMISSIFMDHPYHYPVVGFKQDIWNITSENLYNFYKKHYIPNNATLVIVGKIRPEDAFNQVQKNFGHISPDLTYKKPELYLNKDISTKTVTLYRDIQSPKVSLAFTVPGLKEKNPFGLNLISGILTLTSHSRLNQKLFEQMHLVNNIYSYKLGLFDYDLFFITFEPKDINDNEQIIKIIIDEIQNIIKNGLTPNELKSIINGNKRYNYNLMTNNSSQADLIGEGYLASNNENYLFECNLNEHEIEQEIKTILSKYFRPSVMHRGYLLPIPEDEKQNWVELQEKADQEDINVLNQRVRVSDIEPCKYANSISSKPIQKYDFPIPKTLQMKNGMKVIFHNNTTTPEINLMISLKANSDYDPEEMEGLYYFMTSVLIKGTKNHSYKEIAEQLISMGTSLSISPGVITMSMLSSEFENSLNILNENLTKPKFDEKEIEKARNLIFAELKNYWDNQNNIANDIVYKNIYKNHPYSKNNYGTFESIKKINRNDLIKCFKKFITPKGATLFISGDLSNINIENILEKTIGDWDGPEVEDLEYPSLEPLKSQEINFSINRDQVVLAFAGLSIPRQHEDFTKLRIFDYIFCGNLTSKLYQLREQTGLFYSINGSLTAQAGIQPGIVTISTIISKDKVKTVENLLENLVDNVTNTITQEEVKLAKEAIISSWMNFYATNNDIIATFQFLDLHQLPFDYFNTKRIQEIQNVTLDEIKIAVKKVLNKESLIKVKVGRI